MPPQLGPADICSEGEMLKKEEKKGEKKTGINKTTANIHRLARRRRSAVSPSCLQARGGGILMNIAVQNALATVNITACRCPHDANGVQETRSDPTKKENKKREIQHHVSRLNIEAAANFYLSLSLSIKKKGRETDKQAEEEKRDSNM